MLTITYTNYDTKETATENFMDYETFTFLGDRMIVESWAHFNKDGFRTGGAKGTNAHADLIAYTEFCK